MNTLREAELQVWVKKNLRRARERPTKGDPMTLFAAGMEFGAREGQVSKWENPERGFPSAKALPKVVAWIERRLGEKAPR